MNDPVDMIKIIKELPSRPRGRACIVLTHNYESQKEWVEKLAHQTNSDHINLLELFVNDTELSNKIGEFLVPNLFSFLKERGKSPVLIISGLEFLKATWTSQSNILEQFTSYVETWNQTPCLLFVLQYDKTIASREFKRFRQYTFVVDQKETLAL